MRFSAAAWGSSTDDVSIRRNLNNNMDNATELQQNPDVTRKQSAVLNPKLGAGPHGLGNFYDFYSNHVVQLLFRG